MFSCGVILHVLVDVVSYTCCVVLLAMPFLLHCHMPVMWYGVFVMLSFVYDANMICLLWS